MDLANLCQVLEVGENCCYPDINKAIVYYFLIQIHRLKDLPSENTRDAEDAKNDSNQEESLVPIHLAHPVVVLSVGMCN